MFVENMVRATLISNAGLLLEYREMKLLVDAIYHTTDPFSTPPASRVVRNAGRRAPF